MKNQKKGSRRIKANRGNAPPLDTSRMLAKVPRNSLTTYKIRRAWTQAISYSPATGFFAAGNTVQIQFAASASNINIGGVGVYGPTLPNASEFSALFDQYRIDQVSLRLDWNSNTVATIDVASTPPLIYICADYDDGSDATVNAILQYPGCRTHSFLTNGYTPLVFNLRPLPLKDVAGLGISTGYSPDTSRSFIRTAEMTIPHYGVKFAADIFGGSSSSVTGRLNITCYIDLEFTNPK